MTFEDGAVVELGGTRFRVEVVSPTYRKLHPVDDPLWLIRAITPPEPEEARLMREKLEDVISGYPYG